jgi:hypothetical protein
VNQKIRGADIYTEVRDFLKTLPKQAVALTVTKSLYLDMTIQILGYMAGIDDATVLAMQSPIQSRN